MKYLSFSKNEKFYSDFLKIATTTTQVTFYHVKQLKYLRTLVLGKVKESVTQIHYIQGVERILIKRGLRKFTCEPSQPLLANLNNSKGPNRLGINILKVKEKNPFLINYSCGPIFKKTNFTDDLGIW